MLFRWALRELRRDWKISLFFVLNLSLGLTGFIALEAYKEAIARHLEQNRREILGGDYSVSVRREFTENENTLISETLRPRSEKEAVIYDFFAMLAFGDQSRLVLVKAVDAEYPLYGAITAEDGVRIQPQPNGMWIYPELKAQVGLDRGANVKLGKLDLQVLGVIQDDSTQTFRSASLAPRVFIDRSRLADSGLIQFGSTFTKIHLFRSTQVPTAEDLKAFERRFEDPAIRIESADQEGEEGNRQLNYLSDYLGLVALVALFMAALGASYIWRLFLQARTKDIAILRSLGLNGSQAVLLYVIEASILGLISIIPAIIAAQAFFPILNGFLASITTFNLNPILTLRSLGLGLLLALGTSLLVALPFLLRLREVRPARLFNEEKFDPDLRMGKPWAFVPALAVLWALAVSQSKSLIVGSLFFASLLGVFFLLCLMGYCFLRLLENAKAGAWPVRLGMRSAGRRKVASLSVFVAIGLGSLLINLLPQIKASIQSEMRIDTQSALPSLFMFDIQDEQKDALQTSLAAKNVQLASISPLIRARILKVNGENYEKQIDTATTFQTREEERDARFRNRGINLSVRGALSNSETLLEGKPFSGTWDPSGEALPELSVEFRYADRMGLKIGDTMTFDIQGVELDAKIVNLRRVKWTSFQPNFFIVIQEGVLDDAPKTWIASVSKIEDSLKNSLQSDVAKDFTNVSVIDVERTVTQALDVAEQMSWSLELMAGLALLTGGIVLFSIARSQVRSRRWELNLLKILGASPGKVRQYILAEFTVLAALASVLGAALSLIVSGVLMWQVFESMLTVDFRWFLGTSVFAVILGLLVADGASRAVVKEKAISLLRQD